MSYNYYKVYSDGGSRGNPGPAAIGAVILDQNEKVIKKISKYIGKTTNNQAEYQALLAILVKAKDLEIKNVDCYLDSELVVKQLTGEYKVKDPELAKIFIKIWNMKTDFDYIEFHHVKREKNKLADSLVNQALDKEAAK